MIRNDSDTAVLGKQLTTLRYNSTFKPTRTEYDWISRENLVIDRYISDPMCGGTISWGYLNVLNDLLSDISNLEEWSQCRKKLPILFITGLSDPLSNNGEKVKTMITQLNEYGIRNINHLRLNMVRHKVEYDRQSNKILNEIKQWIAKR